VPSEPSAPETVYVVYLPYLPLTKRATIGDWEVIPRADLRDDDCLDARTLELARGLADLYVLPKNAGTRAGVFARARTGRVGDDPTDPERLRDLRRACVVMVLEVNESPLLSERERDPNIGHYALTSDNATVVAHGISHKGGYTGTVTGSRVRSMSLGVRVVDDPNDPTALRQTIPPPGDVRIPTFRPPALDDEYADATWESMRRGDNAARRLGRAIDWLNLASLNATGLSDELRVPALRAGFEVLLDSEDAEELARRLGRLVDDKTPIRHRTWTSTFTGDKRSANMREVPWWFMEFSFLRNDLMHGRAPGEEKWLRDGQSQTDLGEWYLRQAIKHAVADDGHADVLEDVVWRRPLREMQEMMRRARQPGDDDEHNKS
jgi:hypothetical protein